MSWAGRVGLPSLPAHGFAGQLLASPLRASGPRRIPFPLAHGFAESREAKAYAAGLTARACQRVLVNRLVCVPPLLGRHVFVWGMVGVVSFLGGLHWVVLLFVYCLIWGVLVWVRSLGLGLLLWGLARIRSVGLLRVARPSVPIRRRRLGHMLILSGCLI